MSLYVVALYLRCVAGWLTRVVARQMVAQVILPQTPGARSQGTLGCGQVDAALWTLPTDPSN